MMDKDHNLIWEGYMQAEQSADDAKYTVLDVDIKKYIDLINSSDTVRGALEKDPEHTIEKIVTALSALHKPHFTDEEIKKRLDDFMQHSTPDGTL
tara:strand:+ start:747 stop:1031 length:285 start_codon:yes stop_codon:yes gene_type:complete